MRILNLQTISKNDLTGYDKQTQFNIKLVDTCFISESISVLTYVFQKLVFSVKTRAMKR